MADTVFPGAIQTFPTLQDITASDATLVSQYQSAMQSGNYAQAVQILNQIPNGQLKIVTADYLNTISNTLVALQDYFTEKYSPAYVLSETQPLAQDVGDYWFRIISSTPK